SNAEQIQRVLRASAPMKLTKSYRSSWEIMQFALGISPNEELVPIERHGESPRVVRCARQSEAVERIIAEIEDFQASSHRRLAVIAKTQKYAEKLHRLLAEKGVETRLLDAGSGGF